MRRLGISKIEIFATYELVAWVEHPSDKKSLQINKLEHVLIVQMFPSERDMLWSHFMRNGVSKDAPGSS
jgi:hypothetical protein